jgi:glyoxylase-like metal-dependent hydrolase (beta-lactamase superfamily II)
MGETLNQDDLPAHRIEFAVDWPPGHVACYVLADSEPVLIDAGMPSDDSAHDREATLRNGLDEIGLVLQDIEHLVITHPHLDHIGQVPRILDVSSPTVHAPAGIQARFAQDADALATRVRRNATQAGLTGDLHNSAIEMATTSLNRNTMLLPTEDVAHWIHDGETFSVGDYELSATYTPGHQADHLCYSVELGKEHALLAGDMAMEPFRGVAIHNGLDNGVRETFNAFFDALTRLAELDIDRVYAGHGIIHDEFDQVLARDRASLHHRLDVVEEMLSDEMHTAATLASEVAADRAIQYMIPEVVGAVAHLEAVGRASSILKSGVRYHGLS